MWFDLLHICLSFENGLKENSSYFYCKSLNFHDQWIKLLLTSSFLCNDCLETMSYLYIYLVSIQSVKTFIFSKKKSKSAAFSWTESPSRTKSNWLGQCPVSPDNIRSGTGPGVFKPPNRCLLSISLFLHCDWRLLLPIFLSGDQGAQG
jgi:hypothetical protein